MAPARSDRQAGYPRLPGCCRFFIPVIRGFSSLPPFGAGLISPRWPYRRNASIIPAGFPTTHWSRVARAVDPGGADARAALAELCAAYWYPIYTLVRRLGYGEADALDLTQEYFARLLEKPVLAAADPDRGRFRAFLRADCVFFLNGRRDRDRAQKRGGARPLLSIDARDAEGRYLVEPADEPADRLFERSWALTLLGRAVDRLASEYATTGRGPLFERLQGVLTGGSRTVSYARGRRRPRPERGRRPAGRQPAAEALPRGPPRRDRRHARRPDRCRHRVRDPRPLRRPRAMTGGNSPEGCQLSEQNP